MREREGERARERGGRGDVDNVSGDSCTSLAAGLGLDWRYFWARLLIKSIIWRKDDAVAQGSACFVFFKFLWNVSVVVHLNSVLNLHTCR